MWQGNPISFSPSPLMFKKIYVKSNIFCHCKMFKNIIFPNFDDLNVYLREKESVGWDVITPKKILIKFSQFSLFLITILNLKKHDDFSLFK
jgi:hypothetical protein